ELLEDAQKHKLLLLERDEKSGQHIIRLAVDD
ncbi:MAG: NYN domain-containing protein, partial [Sterolibacteriaceae bacterium]|nr:NYN domain-containing protein [Sterolibacteriaceae bacterium]